MKEDEIKGTNVNPIFIREYDHPPAIRRTDWTIEHSSQIIHKGVRNKELEEAMEKDISDFLNKDVKFVGAHQTCLHNRCEKCNGSQIKRQLRGKCPECRAGFHCTTIIYGRVVNDD